MLRWIEGQYYSDRETADELSERLIDILGEKEVLSNILHVMSSDDEADYIMYIARVYDIDMSDFEIDIED